MKEQYIRGVVVYDRKEKQLKTVERQTKRGVKCVWFDKEQQLHREIVSDSCLESVPVQAA